MEADGGGRGGATTSRHRVIGTPPVVIFLNIRGMIISLAPTIDLYEIYKLVDFLLMYFGEK